MVAGSRTTNYVKYRGGTVVACSLPNNTVLAVSRAKNTLNCQGGLFPRAKVKTPKIVSEENESPDNNYELCQVVNMKYYGTTVQPLECCMYVHCMDVYVCCPRELIFCK